MTAVQTPLAPAQLAQIRDELLRALARLERSLRIAGAAERAVDLEQDTVGRLSRIDALQNQGLVRQLEERERTQLTQIADALRRIDEGVYGLCNACGVAVPFERLLVYPETRACAACATRG